MIKKTFDRLINVAYFMKFNLKNAYYCIRIRKCNKRIIVFRTRYNYFKYIIMLFNLINVSTTFEILINKRLQNLTNYFYIIYFNNMLIYSKTCKEY